MFLATESQVRISGVKKIVGKCFFFNQNGAKAKRNLIDHLTRARRITTKILMLHLLNRYEHILCAF